MKRIVLLVIIVLATVTVWAQKDKKAKEILDKVSEKTRSFSTISADFSFAMKNVEMDIDEKNEGSIIVKGQKYRVTLPDAGVSVYSDGKTIWNYMKNGNQVTITNADDEESELMDPSALFTIYERGFDSKYLGEKKNGGKTVYQIDLFPNSDEFDVSKITLLIDKSASMIHSAKLFGTDGNLYVIEVKNLVPNKKIADSEFVFDAGKFNDVEVIDLR